uniref:BTB domain-containing protein n=1 Tax=Panagrolaimus davidi TaxID=227884 RepID=A0A914PP01_9BILA
MNSTKIEIPFFIRWKLSKEEIQSQFDKGVNPCEIKNLTELRNVSYGAVLIHNEENEIFVALIFLTKQPRIMNSSFKISVIPSNNFYELKDKVFEESYVRWGSVLCSYEKFFDPTNNYFMDGYIYITMEGILSFEKKEQQICDNPKIKSSKNLGELLYNLDDKDFDIFVDGKIVKVHKSVISGKSPVFDRMIQSGFKESKESKVAIIDFDYESVEIAIKYLYGISIIEKLNVSLAIKFLQFSDKYDISDLHNSLEIYLLNKKSPLNICEILNASITSNSIKLREHCFDFILKCLKESIFIKDLANVEIEMYQRINKEFLYAVCTNGDEHFFKKVEIPSTVTAYTIMSLLKRNPEYNFLISLTRPLLTQRRNVRNLVAEFEAVLLRHADLLKRQIKHLKSQIPNPYTPKYSPTKKQINESIINLYVCNEKAKEFEAIILRDKVTSQKLPDDSFENGFLPDMDYQLRLIYEIFMN